MKTIRWTLFFGLLLAGLALAKPAAMVTDLSGQVNIGKKNVQLLDTLEPGSRFKVPAGSKVTLNILSNGSRYLVKGPVQAEVGKTGIRVLVGDTHSVKQLGGRKGATSSKLEPVSLTMGAEFHRKSSMVVLPVGKVLSAKPTYSWFSHPEAELYRLEIRHGSERLFVEETEEVFLPHPTDSPLLVEGESYRVRLTAMAEDEDENYIELQRIEGGLEYVNDKQLKEQLDQVVAQWKQDNSDRSLVVAGAAQCLNSGLYDRALALLRVLDAPDDKALNALQSRVYSKIETLLNE